MIFFIEVACITGIPPGNKLGLHVNKARITQCHAVIAMPCTHGLVHQFRARCHLANAWRPGTVQPVRSVVNNPCLAVTFPIAHPQPSKVVRQHMKFGTANRVGLFFVESQLFKATQKKVLLVRAQYVKLDFFRDFMPMPRAYCKYYGIIDGKTEIAALITYLFF